MRFTRRLDDEAGQETVMPGRVNKLFRDRTKLMSYTSAHETEARRFQRGLETSQLDFERSWLMEGGGRERWLQGSLFGRGDRPQEAGGDERAESCRPHSTAADCSDLDCCTDTTEGDGSTTGTGRHTAGAGDRLTGTGDDITGTGYYLTGTAGTRWGSCTARAARGGW
ncbi:hypothetical protein Tco_0856883 [Tanacetum coccineum]|uniref:Uncharacterized protein n=1 Tax=Tanacetum coccineum TaxID=301880 RepID=A0ABQ5B8K1_9ASTR